MKIDDLMITVHVLMPASGWRVRLLAVCAKVLGVPLGWSASAESQGWGSATDAQKLHYCANTIGSAETIYAWEQSACHYRLANELPVRAAWLRDLARRMEAEDAPT